ncbi:MAG: translation initiation factor IF-2 [Gemmatimonadales bacterium]|nr:MAG: translation initiation factor IF-2 [Gemmatimonadales bacterium]
MRVVELAEDLKVSTEDLLALLRAMGIAARDGDTRIRDAAVAKVLARVERERRTGKKSASDAVQAAIEESQPTTRRRRRRKVEEPEPETVDDTDGEAEESVEVPETVEASAERDAGEGPSEEPAAEPEPPAEEPEPAASETPAVAESEESPTEVAAEPDDDAPAEPSEAEKAADPEPIAATADPEPGTVEKSEDAPAAVATEAKAADEEARPRRKVKPKSARKDAPESAPRPTPAASAGPGGQIRIQADGFTSDGRRKDRKKGKRRQRVDQDAVQDNIQRVMAEIKGGGGGGGKKRRKKGSAGPSREEMEEREEQERQREEQEAKTVKVNEFLTVAELSELIDVPSTQLVGAAFKNLGLMVTINQRLDFDQIELLLEEFNFQAVREEEYQDAAVEEVEEVEDPESLKPRPPVVTVMGHVDHGKTLLLDSVRKTNVVAGESGGITQHIGAYHVELDDGRAISFLDTPGHAAFTAMRARGADLTDIVVLVVAADDSIMPQTKEAISHAKNAGVPIVVAINKMDLPAADAMKVRQELLQYEVTAEEFGGDVLMAEISAKTGLGMDDLLEKILLQAEILELRANPDRDAQGAVVEAKLDVGKGAVVTVMIQKGTLRVGDSFVCGKFDGKVRAMLDERGQAVDAAGPGVPVQILGVSGVPQAGDTLQAMDADRAAEISQTRRRLEREKQLRVKDRGLKLGDFAHFMQAGEVSLLPLIVKADVDGSVQAVADSLEQLSTEEVKVQIIHRSVGAINESDVLLAETAGAVIIGFRVRPDTNARNLAEQAGVDLRMYDVIYEAVDEVTQAMEGLLSPEERESVLGAAEVREVFKISRVGTIAGCYVTDGVIDRRAQARVIRDGVVVYTGAFESLKRFKDDAREVREGYECGIGIENFNDVKVGDVIECFQVEEFARTLAGSGSEAKDD